MAKKSKMTKIIKKNIVTEKRNHEAYIVIKKPFKNTIKRLKNEYK